MIDGKKLAKLFRKSRQVILTREADGYIVTDNYIMVRLTASEFSDFFAKYNSYKRTANIPFQLDETMASIADQNFEKNDLNLNNIVLNRIEEAEHEVEFTEFLKILGNGEKAKVYRAGDQLGIINSKYEFLLEIGDEFKVKNNKSPLFVLKNNEIKVAIMPYVNRGKPLEDEFRKVVRKIG